VFNDLSGSARGRQGSPVRRSYAWGASGYLERLVRADALREAANSMARWYAANPTYVEDSLAETAAALDEAR
jgi:hypothetical protein